MLIDYTFVSKVNKENSLLKNTETLKYLKHNAALFTYFIGRNTAVTCRDIIRDIEKKSGTEAETTTEKGTLRYVCDILGIPNKRKT